MTPNPQKFKVKQNTSTFNSVFKVDDIHKDTSPQSTQLFGIAISQPWVYNLMCMPLLTVLHFKREMQSCLDMCWMV